MKHYLIVVTMLLSLNLQAGLFDWLWTSPEKATLHKYAYLAASSKFSKNTIEENQNNPPENPYVCGPSAEQGYTVSYHPTIPALQTRCIYTTKGAQIRTNFNAQTLAATLITHSKISYNSDGSLIGFIAVKKPVTDPEKTFDCVGNTITIAHSNCSEVVCDIKDRWVWGKVWHPNDPTLIAFQCHNKVDVKAYRINVEEKSAQKVLDAGQIPSGIYSKPNIGWNPLDPNTFVTAPDNPWAKPEDPLKSVALWDCTTGALKTSWYEGPTPETRASIQNILWNPEKNQLAVACDVIDKTDEYYIALYDDNGKETGRIPYTTSRYAPFQLAREWRDQQLVNCDQYWGNTVRIFDTAHQKIIMQKKLDSPVFDVYFSKNKKHVVVIEEKAITILGQNGDIEKRITVEGVLSNTPQMSVNADETKISVVQVSDNWRPKLNTYDIAEIKQ